MEENDRKIILLVDDDAMVRDTIKSVLEREYQVLEASGYEESLRHASKSLDLAIIDYVLPDGEGFDVLKALRKIHPSLPAIIMTGYSNEDVVIKAIRSTVADYIKKPLNLAYLRQRVTEILGGKEYEEHIGDVDSRAEFILDGIATYIKENYIQDLTLDRLARMAGMNRFRFCRGFKKRFGRSFVLYINDIRIDHAAGLLRNIDLSITEIAHFVGFGSFSHFERVFRRVKGCAPREYRGQLHYK